MTFLSLFNKIGKQPEQNTRKSEVCVVLGYDDLEALLRNKQHSYVIPLEMKVGNGEQKMWFVKKPERKIHHN